MKCVYVTEKLTLKSESVSRIVFFMQTFIIGLTNSVVAPSTFKTFWRVKKTKKDSSVYSYFV